LTLYAFSTENWKRPKEEVDALMELIYHYIDEVVIKAIVREGDICVRFIGDKSAFSEELRNKCIEAEELAKDRPFVCNIALNYGGRDEIIKAVQNIATQVKENKLEIESINEEIISNNLYTSGQPDPDLLIRTSGEIRLSNFLPWQLVYSEFLFIDKNWPDFSEEDLDNAIVEYQKRTRKFGAN
jgi:undecaprenyl diphosphate synthase